MFLYDTVAEYDAEIAIVRTNIHNSMNGEEFSLNTSQSNQRVKMASLDKLQDYLKLLTREKKALAQNNEGSRVTSIVPRRTY